ncbi:MAG: prepilin-type N-terminal cleavage/methylation domain-containing protein [Betaproteobacteria bacterium]|nr:prepilin-type N-terminal cleavage/methylation domain-containing protein [Betaproteobacteria bacterium]
MRVPNKKQSGFTLIEIAIVLVIIGLLLGGVLKGQELINSAKVKNFATDFRNLPLYIYGYQDKFKAIPGDDAQVTAHLGSTLCPTATTCTDTPTTGTLGNGVLEGWWNASDTKQESYRFWQHVRLAGLAAGPTDIGNAQWLPRNAEGNILGVSGGATANLPISTLRGTYVACSQGILGKFAKQLDITLDDGNAQTGSLQVMDNQAAPQAATAAAIATSSASLGGASAAIDEAGSYTVCMAF